MFSRFFIRRPIFAIVIAILMVIVGAMAFRSLPIAQYPEITPPTVMVMANYPGADAATVAQTVGEPIEEQVNGVEGMMYMSSSSGSDGSYSLNITFELGTDIDEATVKVQNRVSQVQPTLPEPVIQQGVTVSSQSSDILMFVALEADSTIKYDALYLTNYAQLHMTDALARIPGVGNVECFGGGEYSMRVWLDPAALQARALTPSDVTAAIEAQNIRVAGGTLGSAPQAGNTQFEFTLAANGMLTTPEEFGNIILRTGSDGAALRLKEVARIELGSDSYTNKARVNGRQASLIAISQSSGANAMEVSKVVRQELEKLSAYFPQGVKYSIMMDTTDYISASISDLAMTFAETTLLVMVVILIFLQSWRAVIIPMLTIPVSLIATFAVMKLLGFSINTLTLFGLVLAIAIVVDDAIVVVEDVSRLLKDGKLTPRQASAKAMTELQGPIVGEVLVLMSVFIPTAFVSGITGELYKQFALTIAVATAFSGFNALTFTPAMCALFMRAPKPSRFLPYRWFNTGFAKTLAAYMNVVGTFLKRPGIAIGAYLAITAVAFYAFLKIPTSYIPEEDMGYFMTSIQLPQGASLERTDAVVKQVSEAISQLPEVKDVLAVSGHSFMGGSGSNMAGCFVMLTPWKDRKEKDERVEAVIAQADRICRRFEEPVVFSLNPPAIPGLGMTSGMEMNILDINNLGPLQMSQAIKDLQEAVADRPEIASLTTLYEGAVPQYSIILDRDRITMLDLDLQEVYATLSAFVGGSYVNDFEEFGRMYHVSVKGDGASRGNPEDVLALTVRNRQGAMVPFASFAEVTPSVGQATVNRYNMYESASVTASVAKDASSSQAIAAMEEIFTGTLGDNYSFSWTGEAYQETQGGTTVGLVMLFAVIITFLVLAAQYGSWTDPMAVIIAMPTAILGAVIGCLFMNQSVSIYTQIGIILLLGMSAKNAILIVEYAMDYRRKGSSIPQAALDAGRIRFRPIMMTAFAFIFGVMPMLFATGAGAASRLSLGTAVVFGMVMNALAGTLFVPNFWALLQKFGEKYLYRAFGKTIPQTTIDSPDSGSTSSDYTQDSI